MRADECCSHWECLLARILEMARVAEVIEWRQPRLSRQVLQAAGDLLHDPHPVVCRHVPRPGQAGAPLAPLPPWRGS